MSLYLDTSVLVALFTEDHFTGRAEALFETRDVLNVSDYASAKFASVIARHARMHELTARQARTVFRTFDAWVAQTGQVVDTTPADVRAAERSLRRLDLPLRAPDAIHIAIARRLGAALATFDEKMVLSARKLGAKLAKL